MVSPPSATAPPMINLARPQPVDTREDSTQAQDKVPSRPARKALGRAARGAAALPPPSLVSLAPATSPVGATAGERPRSEASSAAKLNAWNADNFRGRR